MDSTYQTLRFQARRGFLTLRRGANWMLIDWPNRIETRDEVGLEPSGVDLDRNYVRYEPSGWMALGRILKPDDIAADDVFLDVGSGKGRVVLQAARYPFRRVIGVELVPELTEVAAGNLAAFRDRLKCRDVNLVTSDALEYDVPDDVTVIFLYNPFRGTAFAQFLEGVLASVDRVPRPLRLIYSTPMEHEQLMASGRFRIVRQVPGMRPTRAWREKLSIRMYELLNSRSATSPA